LFVIEPNLPHTPPWVPETKAVELVGEAAPELALPRLARAATSAKESAGRIAGDPVSLSSFRGKKVICLFLSSYT
jgi:hypothetical protein